jgi:protoporphyrin/coproporphyrin ferrochelatase
MDKTAVILVNTGSPDDTSVGSVRRYLREFLGDGRVITLPGMVRKALVNGIIVPFRSPKSAKLYQKVWTENGSPLLWHTEQFRRKLQSSLGDAFVVFTGMRYGNPSLKTALENVKFGSFSKLIILPLFPQYASSTSGSIKEFALRHIQPWNVIPELHLAGQFYDHPGFIENVARKITENNPDTFDHIIFSYHGLPLSHLRATHHGKDCLEFDCTQGINSENACCYHATCYETTRLIAHRLNLSPERYSVGFQSRLSKNWLSPFTDELIIEKSRTGKKRLLVVSPSFVTDCLETIMELGVEYKELFEQNGGIHFEWVRCLNDDDQWVDAVKQMIVQ